ncbi:hypothetical protein MGYG_06313 [Nannizzia gypsea CBS 118893]|uniref:Inositol-pentakisphosphate 2-kinase n=1 Tax=Arthroderma gypseum (strain ATCC MYA-4604 / CBS 118893) TaxID=535722 RepID=E4UYY4_ARTGP|nr:hypothetical protein MGYG_06313 [Nannizzia gypsea CBS 118893]EFR03314.1 hypothetical protein MGYG_06313 [Nannizzia gypsea CBS 118893]
MLELAAGVKLTYLAEGAANIVYSISAAPHPQATPARDTDVSGPSQAQLAYPGKLLRLRKEIASGTPYEEITRSFNSQIRSIFRDDELVSQELIKLPDGLTTACNERLRDDEAHNRRPRKRRGDYLCTDEPFGLLIKDMTGSPGSGATLWELKPKWLIQSPSAPPDARRCRTCALREKRQFVASRGAATDKKPEQIHPKKSFCPFDLVSNKLEDVLSAVSAINNNPDDVRRVAAFIHRNPTLLKLRDRQSQMNAVGLAGIHASAEERAVSMTLRDCTMFVKVPRKHNEPFELRLGDLDFKSEDGGKLQYWQDTETELIEEGWYLGAHRSQGKNTECALGR